MNTNILYYGDNLDILRRHIGDESVDLIYPDPGISEFPVEFPVTPYLSLICSALTMGLHSPRILRRLKGDIMIQAPSANANCE